MSTSKTKSTHKTNKQKTTPAPEPTVGQKLRNVLTKVRARLVEARKAMARGLRRLNARRPRPAAGEDWFEWLFRPRAPIITEALRAAVAVSASMWFLLVAVLMWPYSLFYSVFYAVLGAASLYLYLQYLFVMETEVLPAMQYSERVRTGGEARAEVIQVSPRPAPAG